MEQFDLFDIDIVTVSPTPEHPPLGGVNREMRGVLGDSLFKRTFGQPKQPPKGWSSRLSANKISLKQIRDRVEHREREFIVSREVNGKLLTGTSDLDHDEVVAILKAQGYLYYDEDNVHGFLIETFKLG
jgi:hypothetical protein